MAGWVEEHADVVLGLVRRSMAVPHHIPLVRDFIRRACHVGASDGSGLAMGGVAPRGR
jgi:hypothetical protein